jgi:two-component system, OmpR family, KDP operon response regulator KdpE
MTGERRTHILAVDDDAQICRALSAILRTRGYALQLAFSADDAVTKAVERPPDLVILDLSLPDRSGIEVCRDLRSWMTAPILILSVLSGDADKIAGLDAGADDYLTKPFSAGELLARVRALLRRTRAAVTQPPVVTVGDLAVDVARRRVTLSGQDVGNLTPTEFEILLYLARNAGVVVTQREIMRHVWGAEAADGSQTLRVHMSNLRRKVDPASGGHRYIFTEPGVGFRFASPDDDHASTSAGPTGRDSRGSTSPAP